MVPSAAEVCNMKRRGAKVAAACWVFIFGILIMLLLLFVGLALFAGLMAMR